MQHVSGLVLLCALAGCDGLADGGSEPTAATPSSVISAPLSSQDNQDLALLRATTARYHDFEAAVADGFTASARPCTDPLTGATKFFVSPALGEPGVQVDAPEILDYALSPDRDDGYRLVAVTYLQYLYYKGDPENPRPPPVMFGQTFGGPYGSVRGFGPFWGLRVWLQGNPDGQFAFFNPNVDCELPGSSDGL